VKGDIINALFEGFGALFTWRNAFQLRRDREIKGVYWPITVFFATSGLWKLLYYYPSLGQWFSFSAGCFLVLGNIAWATQVVGLKLRARAARRAVKHDTILPCAICDEDVRPGA